MLHFGKFISSLTFVRFASFLSHHQETRNSFPFQILILRYCVLLSHCRIFFRKHFSSTWTEEREETDFKYSSVNRCLGFFLYLASPRFPAKAVGEASGEITGQFPISGWNVPPFCKVTWQVRKQSHQFQTLYAHLLWFKTIMQLYLRC